MSTFDCKVVPITIVPHPNADKLELAKVADYRCVVGKGLYTTGELVVYIPEAAVVPEWALKHYGYWDEVNNKGMLAGPLGNRVKAVKLRNEVSQGIVFPAKPVLEKGIGPAIVYQGEDGKLHHYAVQEGEDVKEILGIVKWEPPIPACLGGEVYNAGQNVTVDYDIENLKKYPDVFVEGEEVVFTEKLHGTSFQIGILPIMEKYHHDDHFRVKTEDGEGYFFIASKGLGAQGLCFKDSNAGTLVAAEQMARNLYIRAAYKFGLFEKLLKLVAAINNKEFDPIPRETTFDGEAFGNIVEPIILQGEVFGDVQDLKYGAKAGEFFFQAFDICIGERRGRRYFDEEQFAKAVELMGIKRCPVLYKGPYSKEKILELTNHTKSTICPTQISEGGVVKPVKERKDPRIPTMGGRVILKSINEDYLIRKGQATEFN
jgi:RNA ligase (TIGR02306 family)